MTALYSDSQDRSLKTAYEKESARERLRKSSLLEFSQTFEGREYMSKKLRERMRAERIANGFPRIAKAHRAERSVTFRIIHQK